MGKKLILVLIALLIGSFIAIQSCNESPLTTPEPLGEENLNNGIYSSNGILIPRIFAGVNNGLPKLCPTLTDKLELWSGKNIYTGYIVFYQSTDPTKIWVQYHFECDPCDSEYPWAVENLNFHIGDKLSDIPTLSDGYPNIGQFAKNMHYEPAFTGDSIGFSYTLPTDSDNDGYYIAAHSDICVYGGVQGFDFYLPNGQVTYSVTHNSPSSYFKINFLNGSGGMLGTGPYEGFCVDADLNIYPPTTVTGHVYSTYESLPPSLQTSIEHWENLDLVNWIMNTYPVGSSVPQYSYSVPISSAQWPFPTGNFTSQSANGTVTWQDLQAAIWALLESGSLDVPWSALQPQSALTHNNVWGIVYAAITTPGAEGFVPGCNQMVTAILAPDEGNIQIITIQPTIIQLEIPCSTCCNDGWGDGKLGANFPGTNWATYFRWDINCRTN